MVLSHAVWTVWIDFFPPFLVVLEIKLGDFEAVLSVLIVLSAGQREVKKLL